ncbi:MAG: hypothetical protein FWC41_09020 [Firmicutes bacterium]|nr:hypothetical protein [Bacillota bacterium]
MKIVSAFGQGNGYGDNKVYVCLDSEMVGFNKTKAVFETEDIEKDAIVAFKYGSLYESLGIPDFSNIGGELKVFYSNKVAEYIQEKEKDEKIRSILPDIYSCLKVYSGINFDNVDPDVLIKVLKTYLPLQLSKFDIPDTNYTTVIEICTLIKMNLSNYFNLSYRKVK